MSTQYVRVNGKTFPCSKSSDSGLTAFFAIPVTESYVEVKTAFKTNTGDIEILFDETVMQTFKGFTELQNIVDDDINYTVTVAQKYDDAESLAIITGGDHPTVAEAEEIRGQLEGMTSYIPDEEAEKDAWAFPAWTYPHDYVVGDRVRYIANGLLYKVVQAHTSQADWTPDVTPALYARVSDPGEEWPEWIQPTGAQDAYAKGDKVSHSDKHWISNADANVWEPGVFGWDEQASE